MAYGQNPNKTVMSDSGHVEPEYPEIYLNAGPYAFWYTGPITGVTDSFAKYVWTAPILSDSSETPGKIDMDSVLPIESITDWSGTLWASRPNGPHYREFEDIYRTLMHMTNFATQMYDNTGW